MKLRLLGVALALLSAFAVARTGDANDCPRKHFSGACIQVITFAINPKTGTCCVYPNPCVVPDGWETSFSGCPE